MQCQHSAPLLPRRFNSIKGHLPCCPEADPDVRVLSLGEISHVKSGTSLHGADVGAVEDVRALALGTGSPPPWTCGAMPGHPLTFPLPWLHSSAMPSGFEPGMCVDARGCFHGSWHPRRPH